MKTIPNIKKTGIIAAIAMSTTFGLTACGGDDSKSAASASHTTNAASQSSSKSAEPSYMKNGKVNPLAVTQDNLGEVCTKLLGDPTKVYTNVDAYKRNNMSGYEPEVDSQVGSNNVTNWSADITNARDENGDYTSFACTPGDRYGSINKPGVYVKQYKDGSKVTAPVGKNSMFHTPNYNKIVDNKVLIQSIFDMDSRLTDVDAQDKIATSLQKYGKYSLDPSPAAQPLSTAEMTTLINKWSDKRVSIVKPFVDKAAAQITAG